MASLIVNNVLSSSVNISYSYIATEELFGYEVVGNYSLNVSDIKLQEGDTVLMEGRDALEAAYVRPNLVARIGADDYINGRIQSFNFDAGALVGSEVVSITIQESRRLESYSNTSFTKYIPNPHWVQDFSESYDFNRNGGDYSSTRNISLSYKQEAGTQFLNDARVFLTNYYFSNRPSFGYQEDGISENAQIKDNYRGLLSEDYDLIGLSVSLSETINCSFIDKNNKVGRKETQSIRLTEQGFLEKTVNLELASLRLDDENVITSAMSSIIDEIISNEKEEFGEPVGISKGIIKDGSRGTATISFSTDPKSQSNSVSYNGSQNKAGKFTEYNLSITYRSDGKNNKEKFIKTKATWVREQKLNQLRIQRLFHPTVPIYEKSRNTNFERSEGYITEGIKFTTDSSFKDRDDGLLKLKKTLSKNHQIDRIEKFTDADSKKDLIVTNTKKTVGQASITAEGVASQSLGIMKVRDALEAATAELNELVDEDTIYMQSDEVSVDLGQGTARRSINYLFLSD